MMNNKNKACQEAKKRQSKSLLVRLSKKRLGKMGLGEMRLGEMLPNRSRLVFTSDQRGPISHLQSIDIAFKIRPYVNGGLVKGTLFFRSIPTCP